MAARTLAEPGALNFRGEPIGPCANRDCGHRDCATVRGLAVRHCAICGRHIGFDRRFYDDDRGLVHAACLETGGRSCQ